MTTTKQLDATDERILNLLAEGELQKNIAKKIKMSAEQVCRRIRSMRQLYGANTIVQLLLLVNKDKNTG